jgi:hypothetical protein
LSLTARILIDGGLCPTFIGTFPSTNEFKSLDVEYADDIGAIDSDSDIAELTNSSLSNIFGFLTAASLLVADGP